MTSKPAKVDPQGMTLEECLEWLAVADGWERKNRDGLDGVLRTQWYRRSNTGASGFVNFPHEPTLDGAAGALPETWFVCEIMRYYEDDKSLAWSCMASRPGLPPGECRRGSGPDEITARYRLAVACRLADKA